MSKRQPGARELGDIEAWLRKKRAAESDVDYDDQAAADAAEGERLRAALEGGVGCSCQL